MKRNMKFLLKFKTVCQNFCKFESIFKRIIRKR